MKVQFDRVPLPLCVLFLVVVALLPEADAQQSSALTEGLSRDQVTTLLGQPMTVVEVGGNEETWEYETPQGEASIRFVGGRAILSVPTVTHSHKITGADADILGQRARSLYESGQKHEAAAYLRECLKMNPRHRRCAKQQRELLPSYGADLNLAFQKADVNDHTSRKRVLEEMSEVDPASEKIRAALQHENQIIDRSTHTSLQSLLKAREALTEAKQLILNGDFPSAGERLRPFLNFKLAAPAVKEFQRSAVELHRSQIQPSSSLGDVDKTVGSLRRLEYIIPPVEIRALLNQATIVAATRIREFLPRDVTYAHKRAYELAIGEQFPNLLVDASDLLPYKGQQSLVANLSVARDGICEGAVFRDLDVFSSARVPMGPAIASDIRVKLRFECDAQRLAGDAESFNSTYVASYQQVVNAEYVRIQQALREAQSEAAEVRNRNAATTANNAVSAFAKGLAEVLADREVNGLLAKLRATPPYLSEPVKLAYAARRYTVTQSVRVSVAVALTDVATSFRDTQYLSSDSMDSDFELENVLPTDAQGFQNRTARLKSTGTLLDEANSKLQSEIAPAAQELLSRALLARAGRATGDSLAVIGNILLADDLVPGTLESVRATAAVESLKKTSIKDLSRVKVDTSSLRLPQAGLQKSLTTSKQARTGSGRASVIETALASIVTIQSGGAQGTGFCVDVGGFILTNHHVVQGASKVTVETRDGSRYLATVVKSSENPDLALLKITGAVIKPIQIGNSDATDVGTDILAIGAPSGLQGSVTKGIVSATRTINGVRYFQIDAAISPGNSGGPLLTEAGEAIGVATVKLVGKGIESLGFAISINEALRLFADVLRPETKLNLEGELP